MKTAISIPDPLNESIEAFLETAGISRSEFFQRAARFYLKKISAKAVVTNLNRVYGSAEEDVGDIAFRRAALSHLSELLDEDKW
jgi:hypothetical protein